MMKRSLLSVALLTCVMAGTANAALLDCSPVHVNKNYMQIDDSQVNACVASGVGNIGNGINDDFLMTGAGAGWTDVTSSVSGAGYTTTGSTSLMSQGTWSVGNALSLFNKVALGFKFGTGNQPDEWFIWDVSASNGNWSFFEYQVSGGNGLSHITLYGMDPKRDVPEPGTLGLLGLGLLGLALARRRA